MTRPAERSPEETRRLLDEAKADGSGILLVETASAVDLSGPSALLELSEDLGLPTIRGILREEDDEDAHAESAGRYDSKRLFAALRASLIARTAKRPLLVRFTSFEAMDEVTLLLLRRLLDHDDGISAVFLFPCTLPAEGPIENAARRLYGLLDLCVKTQMWNRAAIVVKELHRAWDRIEENGLRGLISFRTGMLYVRQGRPADAARQYENAIRYLEAAEDRENLAKSFNNLGNIRLEEGRIDEAGRSFERALALGEELQSDYHLSISYGNYAHWILRKGMPAEAVAHAKKSLLFSARSGYIRHVHYTYALLGECAVAMGLDDLARTHFAKALRVCDLLGNVPDGARVRLRIGRFHLLRARIEEAEAEFRAAEEVYRRLRHAFGLWNALEGRSEVALARRDAPAARSLLEEAETYARSLGDRAAMTRWSDLRARAGASS